MGGAGGQDLVLKEEGGLRRMKEDEGGWEGQ